MNPTPCLEEGRTAEGLECLVGREAPSAAFASSDASDASPDLMMVMQSLADAGRAQTVEELQKGYEFVLSEMVGIHDVRVKIFSSPEEAAQYTSSTGIGNIHTVEIKGSPHGELYTTSVIECADPESAKRMTPKNQLFGIVTETMASKVEDKLKYWKDKRSGLFTEGYILDMGLERRAAPAEVREKGFGIVYLDVDSFKQYNDIDRSHALGDMVIGMVGEAIKGNTRAEDIAVRAGDSADEFMVYAFGCAPEELIGIAERIRAALRAYAIPGHPELGITASFGISHSYETEDVGELRQMADHRAYSAKEQGRDRIVSPPNHYTAGYLQPPAASQQVRQVA